MPRITSCTGKPNQTRPEVGVYSAGKEIGESKIAGQFEYDVTSFRDPTGQKQFAGLNGTYPQVRDWVSEDRRMAVLISECMLLADDMLEEKNIEGQKPKAASTWLSFSFRDYHGKWVAPAVAEAIANALSDAGYNVFVHHKDIPHVDQFKAEELK